MNKIPLRTLAISIFLVIAPFAPPVAAQVPASVGNSDGSLTVTGGMPSSACPGTPFYCKISLATGNANTWTATQTFGSQTLLEAAEQIGGPSSTIAPNSDGASVFLISGEVNPTASGNAAAEIVNLTIAPTGGVATALNSEQHIFDFDCGSGACGSITLLSGHSNQLYIDAAWMGTNPIPLVSSYNPGQLKNNAISNGVQVTKYVLYDSPSGDYTGQAGTTLSNAEFDGLLVYGPTTIPGCSGATCGTLSLNDVSLTVPAASPTVAGTTENVDAIHISGSCGSAGASTTLYCYAIDNESTAPNISRGPTEYFNGTSTAPSLANRLLKK